MALPLKVHKRCRGVLVFGDRESRVIDEELRVFASMAADYLALFLENLYLKNKVKQLAPVIPAEPDESAEPDNTDNHP